MHGSANFPYTYPWVGKTNIMDEGKQDMLTNNALKKGEALANVSVNVKNATYLFVYHTVTCTVTADIVATPRHLHCT